MNEEEIIDILEDRDKFIDTLYENYRQSAVKPFDKAIQGLLNLYQKEKEKNIEAGKLLGKRINMCNQFQIELDKEKEKNKELEKYEKYYQTEKVVWSRNDYISKDKIKEKIKIRKEEKAECTDSIESNLILREIYVLEELLEERN